MPVIMKRQFCYLRKPSRLSGRHQPRNISGHDPRRNGAQAARNCRARRISQEQSKSRKPPSMGPFKSHRKCADSCRNFVSGLLRRLPSPACVRLRRQLASLNENRQLGAQSSAQFGMLSADLEARQANLSRDLAEIEALRLSLSGSECRRGEFAPRRSLPIVKRSVPERRGHCRGLPGDPSTLQGFKAKRDAAAAEASGIVRDMQATQELHEAAIDGEAGSGGFEELAG